jgi:hypothetical protein
MQAMRGLDPTQDTTLSAHDDPEPFLDADRERLLAQWNLPAVAADNSMPTNRVRNQAVRRTHRHRSWDSMDSTDPPQPRPVGDGES